MDDLLAAVLMTAAIPGGILGLWAGIRSGIGWTLLGGLVGLIGGVAGGFVFPGLVNALGFPTQDGPLSVVLGSLVGALILLLLTSGLRKTA